MIIAPDLVQHGLQLKVPFFVVDFQNKTIGKNKRHHFTGSAFN
jgi:hypothetical protein